MTATIIVHPRTSALTGLISAYATACTSADLSHVPTRFNVKRVLVPKLIQYRKELILGVQADKLSSNRAYLPGVMAIISELRILIANVIARIRDLDTEASTGMELQA